MTPPAIARWKAIAKSRDAAGLNALLADDVVFTSPVVHTPQRGKAITTKYLAAGPRRCSATTASAMATSGTPRRPPCWSSSR